MHFGIPALLIMTMVIITACEPPPVDVDVAAVDVAALEDAVRARSEQVLAAESVEDIDKAMTFWAENAIVQPPDAPQIRGKQAVRELYNELFPGDQLADFSGEISHIEVSEAGDLAYEYGVNKIIVHETDRDLINEGKYLIVWKKTDGEWYIRALSFNNNAPAPRTSQ